jgi:hypothetical protein
MYPAIEITLRLDVFAQLSDGFRLPLGPRFGPSTYGTNLLPVDAASPSASAADVEECWWAGAVAVVMSGGGGDVRDAGGA